MSRIQRQGVGGGGGEGKEGKEGPAGATGEYKNTGAWTAKAARTKGDSVKRNGATWACIKTVTLAEDAEPGTAPTIWEAMAEKGTTGAEGPKGETGLTGSTGAEGKEGKTGAEGKEGTTGAEGPKGTTGEYKNTGAWTAKAARTKGDTVTRSGSTWACIKTVTEGEDKEPGTAATIWEVMAEKGAKGEKGEAGGGEPTYEEAESLHASCTATEVESIPAFKSAKLGGTMYLRGVIKGTVAIKTGEVLATLKAASRFTSARSTASGTAVFAPPTTLSALPTFSITAAGEVRLLSVTELSKANMEKGLAFSVLLI